MIPLPPEFKEFFQALNHSKAEYLLVGGYAVAFYGYLYGAANVGHPIWSPAMTACCPPALGVQVTDLVCRICHVTYIRMNDFAGASP